jgi:hypothetical protein
MNDPGATVAHARTHGRKSKRERVGGELYGLLAEFETPGAILAAAGQVREAGYRWWDCHTPFAVHGLDKAMGIRPTILPWLVMGAAMTGTTLGFLLQWFTNATGFDIWVPPVTVRGYEFLVSGKPMVSLQVYPIVMFELTILLGSLGTFVVLMLLNKLPMLYHPCFKSERFQRATDDRFFIVIEARDPKFSRPRTEAFLKSLGPAAVEALED